MKKRAFNQVPFHGRCGEIAYYVRDVGLAHLAVVGVSPMAVCCGLYVACAQQLIQPRGLSGCVARVAPSRVTPTLILIYRFREWTICGTHYFERL